MVKASAKLIQRKNQHVKLISAVSFCLPFISTLCSMWRWSVCFCADTNYDKPEVRCREIMAETIDLFSRCFMVSATAGHTQTVVPELTKHANPHTQPANHEYFLSLEEIIQTWHQNSAGKHLDVVTQFALWAQTLGSAKSL